jgi:hypothetical protein
MNKYPIIKTPDFLSRPNLYEDSLDNLVKPEEPIPHKIKYDSNWKLVLYIFIGMPLLSVTLNIPGFILSIIILIILIYNTQTHDYYKRKILIDEYEEKVKNYKRDYEIYIEQLNTSVKRMCELEMLNKDPLLKILALHNARVKFLDMAKRPSDLNSDIKKGVSEDAFYLTLKSTFNDKILINKSLDEYSPDFIYFDPFYNLYIDLEIDEPYDGISKKPIHFIGADEARDNYFLQNRWCILRFSEKQIIQQSHACCDEIKKLVNSIFIRSYNQTEITEKLNEERAWQYYEAQKMALDNYRDTYLITK